MSSETPPEFSVIVPTCERPEALARCLEALAPERQRNACGYEVIVTDDSCNSVSRRLIEASFPWASWTAGPRRGPASNRNHGARVARGKWLAFVDDDCVPSAEWLGALSTASASRASVLEGRTVCPDRTGHPLDEYIENERGGVFWSCNLAVEKDAFFRLNGFDEQFTEPAFEDMEFAARAQRDGLATAFVPNAIVAHPARRLSFRQLWRRALMIRWFSLYLLKTRAGQAQQSLIAFVTERLMNLLRTNWHALRDFNGSEWRRAILLPLWNTLSFPVLLPYIVFWELRFRKELSEARRSRAEASSRSPSFASV